MTNRLLIVSMLFLLAFNPSGLEAADWRSLVDLRGSWFFTVGDDQSWANPGVNISDWDKLPVPADWDRFYQGYNGYGWYRRTFNLRKPENINNFTLFLGYIDDVDEVFINGHKIGQSGKFPPNYQTAYNQERQYMVPASILNAGNNLICVRVFDEAINGGIVRAERFGLYYDSDENLMDINLSGNWKFSTDRQKAVHNQSFDDHNWDNIYVPQHWENQGYPNYDGYAWYRKKFNVPDNLLNKDFVLVLGKIDDFDKVYLNGEEIGRVEDLDSYSRFRRNDSYKLLRAYKIPSGLLRNKNVISVEIYDQIEGGGIYEGPVGIIERKKVTELSRSSRWDDNYGWELFLNTLFDLLD